MSSQWADFRRIYSSRPVMLAPMEDVSDAVFRRLCRGLGAELCFTEFVNVESLLRGDHKSQRKMTLDPSDRPTAIQIYGSNPETLAEAAEVAAEAQPSFIDINCGCWIPKIVGRGAGAGWLRDPDKMVEMAALIVKRVPLPVTVKTRIGWGPETEMPVVELAKKLEDVGVAALTIHCRTAQMRHNGKADWSWAAKARSTTSMPIIVNGDVRTADDALRAITETGCAGVMVGRGAMEHPWVFREARALLDRNEVLAGPSVEERLAFLSFHLRENVAWRGERNGVDCTRRHYAGYLRTVPGGEALKAALYRTASLADCLELIDRARDGLAMAA
ncbi:MAG: tRNA dihydrouridine synthase DusB [Myxococcaceae bacterium]